jgi:hypothetical protein
LARISLQLGAWEIQPVKWGGDISQQIRDVERGTIPTYTYLGPDGIANTRRALVD